MPTNLASSLLPFRFFHQWSFLNTSWSFLNRSGLACFLLFLLLPLCLLYVSYVYRCPIQFLLADPLQCFHLWFLNVIIACQLLFYGTSHDLQKSIGKVASRLNISSKRIKYLDSYFWGAVCENTCGQLRTSVFSFRRHVLCKHPLQCLIITFKQTICLQS